MRHEYRLILYFSAEKMHKIVPRRSLARTVPQSGFNGNPRMENSPAKARCMMKKFMRDFLPLLSSNNAVSTAELPRTISTNRIHSTVICSVCNKEKAHKVSEFLHGAHMLEFNAPKCNGKNRPSPAAFQLPTRARGASLILNRKQPRWKRKLAF